MEPKASLAGLFVHDLRNALSPARAALELLQRREAGNESLQPALRTIERSLAVALQTIERFVEAQRVIDGTMKLQVVAFDLAGMVERAIDLARPMLAERGQRVDVKRDADDIAVEGDAIRSMQVLAQLIQNAGSAGADGAVIELDAHTNGERVEIAVREPAPRVEAFDAGEALESLRAPARTQGLALATARRLMALQRGALEGGVDAKSGCVEFVMTMPRSATAPAAAPSSAPSSEQQGFLGGRGSVARDAAVPQRILLVDDNHAVRSIYREALEELGYDVTLAANGEDALRAAEGSLPEVALIDVHLPTLNGYQLARALRARHPSSGMKLVLLSGMTLDDDMIRLSKNAGFDHCVDKSAGPKAIDALLRQ
jgi:CheY-like chemotaxis protein